MAIAMRLVRASIRRGKPRATARTTVTASPKYARPCSDLSDPGGIGGFGTDEAQKIAAPGTRILLLLDHRQRSLRLAHRQVGGLLRLRRRVPSRGQLGQRAVPDGSPGVLEQPGERNPVLVRQFQERSWVGGGKRPQR